MAIELRVLIVEDSADDYDLILLELKRAGYQTIPRRVQTRDEMSAALREPWDAIVADFSLPTFDALEAWKLVQDLGLETPFIIVSGSIGEELAVACMRAGIHDYIMKSNLVRLAPAISRELGDAEVRRQRRKAQEALKESERRLALALDGADQGLWDWNLQSGEAVYDHRWARMLDYAPDDIEPTFAFWESSIHPHDRVEALTALQRHLKGETTRFEAEHRLRTKLGAWKWILTRGTVVERAPLGGPLRAVGTQLDITSRKTVEERLMESERRLQDILLQAADAVLTVDDSGHIENFNKSAEEVFGYPADQAIGMEITRLFAFEHEGETAQEKDSILRLGRHEAVGRRSDGTEVPLEVSISEVPLADGGVFTLIARDITQRRQYEETIRARARQQAAVAELGQFALTSPSLRALGRHALETVSEVLCAARCGIFKLQEDGSARLVVSKGWPDGPPMDAVLPEATSRALRPILEDRRSAVFAADDLSTLDGIAETEFLKDTAGGSGAFATIHGKGDPYGLLAVFCHRRRACAQHELSFVEAIANVLSQSLRRELAEQDLRMMNRAIESAMNGILIISAQRAGNPIVYANPAFEHITGFPAESLIGQECMHFIQGTDSEALTRLKSGLEDRENVAVLLRSYRKDGSSFWNEINVAPIRDPQGETTHFVIITNDISDRKALEAQVLRAQRLESIGTMAGGIAHDLNNILTPMLMFVGVLRARLPEKADQDFLDMLEVTVQRGADILKQVLTFARGESGDRVEMDVAPVLRELTGIVEDTFPKNIAKSFEVPDGLWPVHGDPTQLHQVLLNLCVNARDAMPGGGELLVRVENVELSDSDCGILPGALPGRYIRVEVADTGSGIPEHLHDKIFDPFFTTKEVGKGTGLGLSTASSIVKDHGGFFELSSRESDGTRFRIYLPAVHSMERSNGAGSRASLPIGHGQLVLVVDDESSIREIAAATLRAHGYRALTASNGLEALDLFTEHNGDIDLVFTDMMMPQMDGSQAIRAIRRISPSVPIIVASGMGSEPNGFEEAESDAIRRLQKPYSAETLLRALDEALAAPAQA